MLSEGVPSFMGWVMTEETEGKGEAAYGELKFQERKERGDTVFQKGETVNRGIFCEKNERGQILKEKGRVSDEKGGGCTS